MQSESEFEGGEYSFLENSIAPPDSQLVCPLFGFSGLITMIENYAQDEPKSRPLT